MTEFIEIKCLDETARRKLLREIEEAITGRKKAGVMTDREIREIEEMRLKPSLDIQDVQSVYQDFLYRKST